MRLRPLTEAECYTRCYGGGPGDRVTIVRVTSREEERRKAERLRLEQRRKAA